MTTLHAKIQHILEQHYKWNKPKSSPAAAPAVTEDNDTSVSTAPTTLSDDFTNHAEDRPHKPTGPTDAPYQVLEPQLKMPTDRNTIFLVDSQQEISPPRPTPAAGVHPLRTVRPSFTARPSASPNYVQRGHIAAYPPPFQARTPWGPVPLGVISATRRLLQQRVTVTMTRRLRPTTRPQPELITCQSDFPSPLFLPM
jgi:hypothetical protein